MRLIRTRESQGSIVVEIEGHIDAVTAHDLRHTLEDLVEVGRRHIALDLTRVQHADTDGINALVWCSAYAIHTGRVLTWMGCSRPLRDLLEQDLTRSDGEAHT